MKMANVNDNGRFEYPYQFTQYPGPLPGEDPRGSCLAIVIGIVLALVLLLLAGCSSPRNVSSEKTLASASVKTDSSTAEVLDSKTTALASERLRDFVERGHDTVIVRNTTVIREVDSAELSRYGILLDNQRRAYLIQEKEMRERISYLQSMLTDSMRVLRDSLSFYKSRDYSLAETSKSVVEDSATEEVKVKNIPLLVIILLIVLTANCVQIIITLRNKS